MTPYQDDIKWLFANKAKPISKAFAASSLSQLVIKKGRLYMEQISANDKYILPSGLSGVIVEDDAADVEQTSQQFDKQVEDSDPQTCCPAKVKSIL